MTSSLEEIVDLRAHPLESLEYREQCKAELDEKGALVLHDFLTVQAVQHMQREGAEHKHLAYYTKSRHNVYLKPEDGAFASDHPRNRNITSSKGCITADQIPSASPLHELYGDALFRSFVCSVLGETKLYAYADTLSSINLHYASEGQELGWHFDNSSFAITLLIQKPDAGGEFEYVRNVRHADTDGSSSSSCSSGDDSGDDNGDNGMNYVQTGRILDGQVETRKLVMNAGDLVLFRGRDSLHRVSPTIGSTTRMLVVLAYNTEPGICLSESARLTFYGRLA